MNSIMQMFEMMMKDGFVSELMIVNIQAAMLATGALIASMCFFFVASNR